MSRFGLDDVQAQAILDMRLKALQGLDREKLQNEYNELEKRIAYFNASCCPTTKMRQGRAQGRADRHRATSTATTARPRFRTSRTRSTSRTSSRRSSASSP